MASPFDVYRQAGFSDEEILAEAGFSPEEIGGGTPAPSMLQKFGDIALQAGRSMPIIGGGVGAVADYFNPPQQSQESEDYQRGIMGQAAQGVAGFGDEISAAGGTLANQLSDAVLGTDYTQGLGIPDTYNSYLNQARTEDKQFQSDNPTASLAAQLAGAMTLPMGKITGTGIKAVGQAAGQGAKMGGLFGVGGAEGGVGETVKEGAKGAVTGAALSAALQGVLGPLTSKGAKKASDIAEDQAGKLERSALGITANDLKKSAEGAGRYEFEKTGAYPIINSLERIKERGGLAGAKDPLALIQKGNTEVKTFGKELMGVLKKADDALPEGGFSPKFERAKEFIQSQPSADRAALTKKLSNIKASLDDSLDGSLSKLQEEKVAYYFKKYTEKTQGNKDLERAIAQDIKEAIESGVDDLVKQGKLTEVELNTVRSLNSKIGDWEKLRPALEKALSREESADAMKTLIATMRTTGGFGVAGALGYGIGGLPGALGVGALGAYGVSPAGRHTLAATLRGGGSALEKASELPISQALTRALIAGGVN